MIELGKGDEYARARIGIVLPSNNIVMESWVARVLPPGVSAHFARMLMPPALTPEGVKEMDRVDGRRAIEQIARCKPAVIAYGCTASSIVQGLAYDQHLREEIGHVSGGPATTAAHAILTAAKTLGVSRVSAVSPYTEAIDEAEHRYFEGAGLHVLSGACLGITDNFALAEPSPQTLYDLAMRGYDERAEAIIVSCLNTRSHTVIEALEERTGKPVITSTQATLWHALRLAGIKDAIPGGGRLMREH